MPLRNYVRSVTAGTVDHSVITTSYGPVFTSGLTNPCFQIRITNQTDVALDISLDGTNLSDLILPAQVIDLNMLPNQNQNEGVVFSVGTNVYVKAAASGPTTGVLVVSGYYQPSNLG